MGGVLPAVLVPVPFRRLHVDSNEDRVLNVSKATPRHVRPAEPPDRESATGAYALFGRFWPYYQPDRRAVLAISALMVLAIPPAIAAPFLIRYLIDDVVPQRDVTLLVRVTALAVGLSLAAATFNYLQRTVSIRVHNRVSLRLSRHVFSHVLRLPIAFFRKNETGYLMARVRDDVQSLEGIMPDRLLQAALDLVKAMVILAVLFVLDQVLATLGALLFVSMALMALLASPVLRVRSRQLHEQSAHTGAALHQSMSGIRLVRTAAREDVETERFSGASKIMLRARARHVGLAAAMMSMTQLLGTGGAYVIIAVGAYRISLGVSTFGSLFAFFTLLMQLIGTTNTVFSALPRIQASFAALQRVFGILDEEVEANPDVAPTTNDRLQGAVCFRDVSYRYEDGSLALDRVNLDIRPGEVVTLVGRSGAGKSTLTQLLPRVHEPTEGEILLDGRSLTSYPVSWLRQRIGVVEQDTFLFDRSIRENVAYARRDATDAMIVEACRAAHAESFILDTPRGYDTLVGEGGVRLSGGQRQRLAIAREILRDPAILILDEATSHLDAESEALIREAMERLMRGRTCLIVAHRLATIRRADRIVVMDRGRVVGFGTHDELFVGNAIYRHFYELQRLDGIPALDDPARR